MSGILSVDLTKSIFSNLMGITKNNIKTLGSYKNIFRNIIISPFPCESSKFITDTVCGKNLTGFKQIRHLADKSRNLISKLLSKQQVKKNTANLQNNINKINKINSINKDHLLCSLSKFTTHGICKLNEINIRLLSNKMQAGLIGTSIIPNKVDSALDSSSNILTNNLSDSELTSELENIDNDLTDISDVNDSMEEVISGEEVKTRKNDTATYKESPQSNRQPRNTAKDKLKRNKKTLRRSSKSKLIRKKQQGGAYNNIVDPISNKLVSINSALGKKILADYVNKIK